MRVTTAALSADQAAIENLETMAQRLRRHAIRCTNKAGSGHPTSAMSCSELIAALFFHNLRYDLKSPKSLYNDRFILSKGHATPALWAVLAEAGIYTIENLINSYRQFGSDLEGHPTPRNPYVDAATGALGQGLSVGVGMALRSRIDRINNHIYVLMGDGETAESAVWEAAAMAAHYKLNNLVAIVDINRLGQTEETMHGHDIAQYERKFNAFGWQTRAIDGHNMSAVLDALQEAIERREQPFVILAKTFKGKGVSFLEDENGRHGKPITGEEFEKALKEIGEPEFSAPLAVTNPNIPVAKTGGKKNVATDIESPSYKSDEQVPTRKAYATGLAKLGKINRNLVVLDAKVKNSTYTEEF